MKKIYIVVVMVLLLAGVAFAETSEAILAKIDPIETRLQFLGEQTRANQLEMYLLREKLEPMRAELKAQQEKETKKEVKKEVKK